LAPKGIFAVQAGSPYANRSAFWSIRYTLETVGFGATSMHTHIPTFGEWGWHVAKLGQVPVFSNALPEGLAFLDATTLKASQHFQRPLRGQESDKQLSTRIDPWIMRFYQRGEPLSGMQFFPGEAER
jgi:spermidine synthase